MLIAIFLQLGLLVLAAMNVVSGDLDKSASYATGVMVIGAMIALRQKGPGA